jgi:hypothetical protein
MHEFMKLSLPHVNWEAYALKSVDVWEYTWPYPESFDGAITIVIEEITKFEDWMIPNEWYSNWFHKRTYYDRPLRTKTLTIIEKRKKWKHKATGKIRISPIHWLTNFESTQRALDLLDFLKYTDWEE